MSFTVTAYHCIKETFIFFLNAILLTSESDGFAFDSGCFIITICPTQPHSNENGEYSEIVHCLKCIVYKLYKLEHVYITFRNTYIFNLTNLLISLIYKKWEIYCGNVLNI